MTKRFAAVLTLGFACGAFAPVACTVPNPDHCVNNGGDDYCQEQHDDAVYCSDNSCVETPTEDGCQQTRPPDECYFCDGTQGDCGNAEGDGDGDSGDGDGDSGDGDGDSGDGDGDSGDGDGDGDVLECMSSSECADPAMPLCEAGACVACGDAAATDCAGEYPETPVCDAGNGMCVLCSDDDATACEGGTPMCMDNSCVPCTEHEQCGGSACNMESGACFPEDSVFWVDNGSAAGGDGSMEDPFDTIGDGLQAIANGGGVGTLRVIGGNSYLESISVNTDQTVAILGESDVIVEFGGQGLVVNPGGAAFVSHLDIDASTGVSCQGIAWLDNMSIIDCLGGGILITSASASVVVRNSFVGGLANTEPAISLNQGHVSVIYSTLATGFDAPAIQCGVSEGSESSVQNSLVLSRLPGMDEIDGCGMLEVTGSALEMAFPDNVQLLEMDTAWFVGFNAGDFHLSNQAPAEIATAATWSTGDPRTDIDGDPRPTVDGEADYAGADVP